MTINKKHKPKPIKSCFNRKAVQKRRINRKEFEKSLDKSGIETLLEAGSNIEKKDAINLIKSSIKSVFLRAKFRKIIQEKQAQIARQATETLSRVEERAKIEIARQVLGRVESYAKKVQNDQIEQQRKQAELAKQQAEQRRQAELAKQQAELAKQPAKNPAIQQEKLVKQQDEQRRQVALQMKRNSKVNYSK